MEEWKDIEGFEGYYQVSNYGNGRSVERTIKRMSRWGKMVKVTYPSVELKKCKCGKYRKFDLYKNGVYTHRYIHQLVWETFVGKIPEGLEIDHIIPVSEGGGDELSNLRIGTRKDNMHNENTYKKYFIPCSEEKKKHISETSKGRHYSPSTEFKKGQNAKRVDRINEETGEVVNSFESAAIAAEVLGYSNTTGICACANGRIPHYKHSLWKRPIVFPKESDLVHT